MGTLAGRLGLERRARMLLNVLLALAWAVLAAQATAQPAPALRVGAETGFPPFSEVDTTGQPTGFAVELFAAAAQTIGIPIAFRSGSWDTVWQALKAGDIDALPLVARLPEREGQVEFTRPHTVGYDVFFTRRERAAIATIEAARPLRIIVLRSDAAHDALASRGFGAQLVPVASLAEGLRLLAAGRHDALLAPLVQGNMLVKQLGLGEAVVPGPLLTEYRREFCFAVRKGDTVLRERLDEGIAKLKASGEYDRLYRKWLGIHEPVTFPVKQVALGAAAALGLLALLGLWTWTLSRQVRRRTAELAEANATLERRVAERTEALQRANDAKTAFLANMSHEIRTPLNAILGMAHLLRRGGVTPKQEERLAAIDTSVAHLIHVVNDILDISKIEAGKFVLAQTDVSVAALMDAVASMIASRANDKGLHLVVDEPPILDTLRGDSTRLTQALLNYAGNAVKFSERGTIVLRCRRVEENADDVLLRFEVEDQGIGIAPQEIERLFGAFEQADNSTTRKYGGTGLGLAITRRLAQLMGGEAGATSMPGAGSTFWFTARLGKDRAAAGLAVPAAAGADPAEAALARHHGGKRLLLAEDHPLNRAIMAEMFGGTGLVVDLAEDGVQAVEMAQRQEYDIILMDVQMPRLDGLDAARQIRLLPGRSRVPILAITANAFGEDRERCLDAGMDDHIPKAGQADTLHAAVLKWLDATAAPAVTARS